MKFKKVDLSFQSCGSEFDESEVIIFSCPLDTTTSFRPGTRFAGNQIRVDSIGIEWYSPHRQANLKSFKTCDIGDLDLPVGDVEKSINLIYETTKEILNEDKKTIMIGGEHLASYPVIKAHFEKYPNLKIIHLDAHTDLREEFLGMKFSHATFMRHVHKLVGDNKIYQFGIRSGDEAEFKWVDEGHVIQQKFEIDTLKQVCDIIKEEPVYITIDLDVLDPGVFPGTGTPEPGGISYKELLWAFNQFETLNNIVGLDIVELSPMLDPSGASTAVAVKTLREGVLLLHKNRLKR
ncbi:MAG: agmatinase [Acholeplasmataceae bacterium]|nr:agmatinase [Acholeplasmataceae bacterium]